ncbi:MAG: hypothetical protein KDJ18_13710 [Hyphomicrobiaceae bacterium]|nr:hypothetical protein [Hyphomicrobiaceae bacterium]
MSQRLVTPKYWWPDPRGFSWHLRIASAAQEVRALRVNRLFGNVHILAPLSFVTATQQTNENGTALVAVPFRTIIA